MTAPSSRATTILATLTGLAASWIAFDLLILGYGESPARIFALLFEGTWGTAYGAGQVLFKATPLLFTGVAVDIALRAGLFNIGAEGQLVVASLAVGVVGAYLPPGTSALVALPLLATTAIAAGGGWAAAPAYLRAKYGASEVISTIMMNGIASALVGLVFGFGVALKGTVRTADVVAGAKLARLETLVPALHGSAASVAILVAVALAFAMTFAFARLRAARETTLVGLNATACEAEHIPVARRLGQAFVVSGAVAGLASLGTVLGYKGYYEAGLGAGAGFGGLAVALLGQGSAVGLVLAALLFGTLQQGGLAINAVVPMTVMDVLQGVVILAVALADARVRAAVGRMAVAIGRGKGAS